MRLAYSDRALGELEAILDYVEEEFGALARIALIELIDQFETRVVRTPALYPAARTMTGAHVAVLHRRLIVVYEVWSDEILVVDAWDTRRDK